MVVRESGADIASASFDIQMSVGRRGRERTLTEWKSVIQGSGMALEEAVRPSVARSHSGPALKAMTAPGLLRRRRQGIDP
jgi:hypothetical protein